MVLVTFFVFTVNPLSLWSFWLRSTAFWKDRCMLLYINYYALMSWNCNLWALQLFVLTFHSHSCSCCNSQQFYAMRHYIFWTYFCRLKICDNNQLPFHWNTSKCFETENTDIFWDICAWQQSMMYYKAVSTHHSLLTATDEWSWLLLAPRRHSKKATNPTIANK